MSSQKPTEKPQSTSPPPRDNVYRSAEPSGDTVFLAAGVFGQEAMRGVAVAHAPGVAFGRPMLEKTFQSPVVTKGAPEALSAKSGEIAVESVPAFLERTHQRAVVTSALSVVLHLMGVLGSLGVDFIQKETNKAKLKVVSWHRVYMACISITVFRDVKADCLIVEFQRRRGDCHVFNTFYKAVLAQCTEIFGAGLRVPKGPLRSPLDCPEDDCLTDEGLRPLVEMVLSPYNDVSIEGARALAAAAANPASMRVFVASSDAPAVLEALMSATDVERACCGSALIKDATKDTTGRKMYASLVEKALRFFGESSLEWRETHRYLAGAAANYAGCASLLKGAEHRLKQGAQLDYLRPDQRSGLQSVYEALVR